MGILGINHIAFRTPDPARLKTFYRELLGAEELDGSHDPLRVGHTLLVFFASDRGGAADDPDELAFDADRAGFDDALERARRLDALQREPVDPTPWSKAFLASAYAAVNLTTSLESLFKTTGFGENVATTLALVIVTLVLSLFTIGIRWVMFCMTHERSLPKNLSPVPI